MGGTRLLYLYHNSVSQSLFSAYPEYDWLPWKFGSVPKHFWENAKNQRNFVEWAGKELKIKEMSDWYNVKNEVFKFFETFPC